ncbi:hypothetical protein [Curtobacterium aetherium]|uniref:Uncharacterized protein n=1 Tax=Curtobacterium aetherium TaxID=2841594 RepID=A0ACD1E8I5_9MICO|nr:hypothetical protein [Curtobacterium sp. L6-1]QWS35268.1 hypothetical protein KM842_10595 [Curtobacterium sp. L6-1]
MTHETNSLIGIHQVCTTLGDSPCYGGTKAKICERKQERYLRYQTHVSVGAGADEPDRYRRGEDRNARRDWKGEKSQARGSNKSLDPAILSHRQAPLTAAIAGAIAAMWQGPRNASPVSRSA